MPRTKFMDRGIPDAKEVELLTREFLDCGQRHLQLIFDLLDSASMTMIWPL